MTKNTDAVTPWICPRCGEKVHVKADIHAYLCKEYQKRKENAQETTRKGD